jgi:putative PIN family toxin of toxin-antitoxin system
LRSTLGYGHDEPLGKERSSFLLKSLPLYSLPRRAARVVCGRRNDGTMSDAQLAVPAVVLDTNVVLDWLVFRDATCPGLATMLQTRQLRWHVTATMRSELASLLPRPRFQRWAPDCEHILNTFDRLAHVHSQPSCAIGLDARLRCRDPDDQKFIDLAVAIGARWLLSKDRALLALARPARTRGIEILTPAQWQRQTIAPHGSF